MTARRKKLWFIAAATVPVLLLAGLLYYARLVAVDTGYEELRREALRVSGSEAAFERKLAEAVALAEKDMPQRPPEHWQENPNIYEQLVEAGWRELPFARRSEDPETWQQSTVESGRSYLAGMLHWEVFPATIEDPSMPTWSHGAGELAEAPTIDEVDADFGAPLDRFLAMLEWRFVHAALLGDAREANATFAAWVEVVYEEKKNERGFWHLLRSMSRMLNRLAALEEDAPPEAFALLDAALLELIQRYDPGRRAFRIDEVFRREHEAILEAGVGTGFLAGFFGGVIPRIQKRAMLPLLRIDMEKMAVAVLEEDTSAFVNALYNLNSSRLRTSGHWESIGFYDTGLFIDLDWITTEEESTLSNWPYVTFDESVAHADVVLQMWRNGDMDKQVLLFHHFVLKQLQHRRLHGAWPTESELTGAIDDGEVKQGMLMIEQSPILLNLPIHQQVDEARAAYWQENETLPVSLDDLRPHLPKRFIPLASRRYVTANPRPLFFRMDPGVIFADKPTDFIFIPTTFSDEFRRFMRGEDVLP